MLQNSVRNRLRIGLAIAMLLAIATPAQAQFARKGMFIRGGMIVGAQADAQASPEDRFAGQATLENDPEIERVLRRAQQAAEDQRYELAVALVQKVLDGTSGMLILRGRQTIGHPELNFEMFKSVRDEAEHLVAKLPADGLHVYRLTADGEAKGLMAAGGSGPEREAALFSVVRRFFLSSYGDDAAYELGCLLLDRHEFVAANRLFSKILNDHPDPSVSREQVLLRVAVANARLGDAERTRVAIAELEKPSSKRLPAALVALVKADVGRAKPAIGREPGGLDGWPIALGTSARDGHMPNLSESYFQGTLADAWADKCDLKQIAATEISAPRIAPRVRAMQQAGRVAARVPATPQSLVERWKQAQWTPVGQVLIEKDRVYYRSPTEARCLNAKTGELIFPTHKADAPFDVAIQQMWLQMANAVPFAAGRPNSMEEVLAFGDRLNASMSLIDGVLYVLESPAGGNEAQMRTMRNGTPDMRARANLLAAYSTHGDKPDSGPNAGGKLRWKRGGDPPEKVKADEPNESPPDAVRFVAAPVPCAGSLIVPVREGATLWIYSLAPRDEGRTEWKTFLCDEPRGGISQWLPVGVAVDGGDIYVASGCGVVFCLEGSSGVIRWATRYQRTGGLNINPQQFGIAGGSLMGLGTKGWDEDVLIPRGRMLVVLPSDAEQIYGLDRRTGEVIWPAPKETSESSAKYCLGVLGEALYVAGNDCVRRYNIAGGRMVWEQHLDSPSLGRGCLTADAIYVPVKDSILKLDPQTGKRLAQLGVTTTDDLPVGNLFSSGKLLFVVGPDRVSALCDAKAIAPQPDPPKPETPSTDEARTVPPIEPGDDSPAELVIPFDDSDVDRIEIEVRRR